MYGHSPSPYKPVSSRPGSLVGMVMALHTVIIQFIMGMGTYKLSHHKQNVTVQLGESWDPWTQTQGGSRRRWCIGSLPKWNQCVMKVIFQDTCLGRSKDKRALIVAQRTCDDKDWLCLQRQWGRSDDGVSCEGLLPRRDKGSKDWSSKSQDPSDKGYPSEVNSRDGTRDEASARTQVYLSKTKLRLQVDV